MRNHRSIEDRAWENYWREQQGRGCVPDAPGIASVLADCWTGFARMLPLRTAVLDVGTGAGAVLTLLGASRPDLELIGVDSIASLPGVPAAGQIRTGVRMEALPFRAASFGAACSQFGFEYSDMVPAAWELARVLKPASPVRLVVHHRDGPVVRQSASRLEALRWAIERNDFFANAERLAHARAVAPLPTPASFQQAITEARHSFPHEPVAAEVLTALHSILTAGERRAQGSGVEINSLRNRASDEIATLSALMRAAQDRAGMAALVKQLDAAGIDAQEPVALVEPQRGLAFAWVVDGTRRGGGLAARPSTHGRATR